MIKYTVKQGSLHLVRFLFICMDVNEMKGHIVVNPLVLFSFVFHKQIKFCLSVPLCLRLQWHKQFWLLDHVHLFIYGSELFSVLYKEFELSIKFPVLYKGHHIL